ncbi:hypothetical protein [Nocardia terpenica]|uniref:Uncharacterized protein n=1 Tax=Nocardia terpenica TaxID=455432 RepID=A0A164HVD6_9NOCA|nr:hypothetical protein [Nocardia terpenica]KZM68853.1 hypothetical protein AWN90_13775 [Nocardia terpenica]NQE88103.1 hypothetical protein [Nocardia terpenica]
MTTFEQTDSVFAIADAVAHHIGPGWYAEGFGSNEGRATIQGPNGMALLLTSRRGLYSVPRGMIRVLPQYGPARDHLPKNLRGLEINVSIDKASLMIAREINRRLMPAYEHAYAVAIDAWQGFRQQELDDRETEADLVSETNATWLPGMQRGEFGVHGRGGDFRVRDGQVRWELLLPPEESRALARFLAGLLG